MTNILKSLWDLVNGFGSVINRVWDWLFEPLVISIEWFKIPVLLPDGVNISTGIIPIAFFGVGIFAILVLWLIKALVPVL